MFVKNSTIRSLSPPRGLHPSWGIVDGYYPLSAASLLGSSSSFDDEGNVELSLFDKLSSSPGILCCGFLLPLGAEPLFEIFAPRNISINSSLDIWEKLVAFVITLMSSPSLVRSTSFGFAFTFPKSSVAAPGDPLYVPGRSFRVLYLWSSSNL